MHYVMLLLLGFVAFYILVEVVFVGIVGTLMKGLLETLMLVIALGVFVVIEFGLYKFGRLLGRILGGEVRALLALSPILLFNFPLVSFLLRRVGTLETHWFRPDVWKPDTAQIIGATFVINAIVFLPMVIGVFMAKHNDESSNG